ARPSGTPAPRGRGPRETPLADGRRPRGPSARQRRTPHAGGRPRVVGRAPRGCPPARGRARPRRTPARETDGGLGPRARPAAAPHARRPPTGRTRRLRVRASAYARWSTRDAHDCRWTAPLGRTFSGVRVTSGHAPLVRRMTVKHPCITN